MQSNSGAVSAKKDDKFFHKTFPNFVWLLRDALLSIPQDCKDLKDYFLKKVRIKVHLTPKIFFPLNKFCYHLEHFFAKIF